MVHCVLPESIMYVVLIPIIKDKKAKISSIDNYRPVAIARVVSKVVERILLDRLSEYLDTMSNQFDFKPKLGTDMCIYSLKDMIGSYSQLNGCVFSCFLDASKAFDRVKHSMLFTKLLKRGAPGYIARLLMFWYAHQTMCVSWGSSVSSKFTVSNAVRQGRIMSLFLFNEYMDDLSVNLKECPTGCIAGGTIVKHLMYADDMVLQSPSATGLSLLLHVCGKYGFEHDIRFNSKKSAVIICLILCKEFSYPYFVTNGESIKEVPFVKYLGHVISADMKDDLDIMRQCRQLHAQGNALARRFHMCSDNVKVPIVRSYCSPLYTSQLWWKYKINSIRKLYVSYNNAFRMLFMLPRDCSESGMFAVHNVMSCPALVRKLVFGVYKRVKASQNYIVQAICASDF